jgi:hypothetical protein
MEKNHPKVVLTARDADGAVVRNVELTPEEWYDSECPLNDSDEECRRLSVRTIEGYQTNSDGNIIQRWLNRYDAEGRLDELGEIESNWEPTIPPPPPGQSAADQLRRLGLLPGLRRAGRDDDERQLKLPTGDE